MTSDPRPVDVTPLKGWFAVGVLLSAYAVSFLDRQLLTLLVQPIEATLGITDAEMGLLQGPAFAAFYATMGLPLGWLADRTHRVRLIAAAILFWSAMTAASGLASQYHHLLLARFGVGFGEAALVPAAVSLLADLFSSERRALPVSVFTCGLAVGSGLALTLGGALIGFATSGATDLPLIGYFLNGREPWQIVFILAGFAGLPVAALVTLLPEPRTLQAVDFANHASATLRDTLRHLGERRTFFIPMLTAMGGLFVVTTSLSAWFPSVFIRDHGWSGPATGYALGSVLMVSALLGNLVGGSASTWLALRGHKDAVLRTMLVGAAVMVPCAALATTAATPQYALGFAAPLYLAMSITFGIAPLAFVEITPPRMRGQVVSIYLLLSNLLGLSIGPPLVGVLTTSGIDVFATVGVALAAVCLVTGLPSLLALHRARGHYAPQS